MLRFNAKMGRFWTVKVTRLLNSWRAVPFVRRQMVYLAAYSGKLVSIPKYRNESENVSQGFHIVNFEISEILQKWKNSKIQKR